MKEGDPQNTSELRLVVCYWAILMRIVMKRSQAAVDIQFFKSKSAKAWANIGKKVVQNQMRGLLGKVRRFGHREKIKTIHRGDDKFPKSEEIQKKSSKKSSWVSRNPRGFPGSS